MKLYHFTSHLALPLIEQEGICYGDIPITDSHNFGEDTGIWLSSDKAPHSQGWQNPKGQGPFIDKTAIRLEVEIPEEAKKRLWRWSDYAAINLPDEAWQKRLENVPGGGTHWFVFKGVILPEWIVAKVELKKRTYPFSVVKAWNEKKRSSEGQRFRIRD